MTLKEIALNEIDNFFHEHRECPILNVPKTIQLRMNFKTLQDFRVENDNTYFYGSRYIWNGINIIPDNSLPEGKIIVEKL